MKRIKKRTPGKCFSHFRSKVVLWVKNIYFHQNEDRLFILFIQPGLEYDRFTPKLHRILNWKMRKPIFPCFSILDLRPFIIQEWFQLIRNPILNNLLNIKWERCSAIRLRSRAVSRVMALVFLLNCVDFFPGGRLVNFTWLTELHVIRYMWNANILNMRTV